MLGGLPSFSVLGQNTDHNLYENTGQSPYVEKRLLKHLREARGTVKKTGFIYDPEGL